MKLLHLLSCFVLNSAFAGFAYAQATTGLPPFSTIQSGLYDSVKINDGSILLTLPIRSKAGLIPFSYSLNSNIYVSALSNGYASVSSNGQGLAAWTPQTSIGLSPYTLVAGVGSPATLCPDGKTYTATNNPTTAQKAANIESYLTAGAGFVNSKGLTGFIQGAVDWGLSTIGVTGSFSDSGATGMEAQRAREARTRRKIWKEVAWTTRGRS